jgi:UDP-N-acetyl-D-glucosamine dehydrogenase
MPDRSRQTEIRHVGVMGLGYVGLTEAVELARAGVRVTGFDIDADRVGRVNTCQSYLVDIPDGVLKEVVGSGRLDATTDFAALAGMDAILICVPTPLSKSKAPDISYIVNAVDAVRATLRPGQLVVLESTTYPGTTDEIVRPALESMGLVAGRDFHLCFSPERINPGDTAHPPGSIPRIIGGVTRQCAEVAGALYAHSSPEIVFVSSTRAAEMVKLLENTFRAVNIGLVNELALMCRGFGVDVWEIVEAAATKPFGFLPFYPGPGLGGHCIPVDPLYLSWKARVNGFEPRFIELAHSVNSGMPSVVVALVMDALNARGIPLKDAVILIMGVAYKRDVNDARESPAVDIIEGLKARGAKVLYHDPYVPTLQVGGRTLTSVEFDDRLARSVNCVVIVTDHRVFDYKRIVDAASLVVDTRNATRGLVEHRDRVVRL